MARLRHNRRYRREQTVRIGLQAETGQLAARRERGTLIASGFIAGGALMGVISALLRYFGFNWVNNEWQSSHSAELVALIAFAVLCAYVIWDSMRGKPEEN